jgi:hypothetical protein
MRGLTPPAERLLVVSFGAQVKPSTKTKLRVMAAERGCTLGEVLDELAEAL